MNPEPALTLTPLLPETTMIDSGTMVARGLLFSTGGYTSIPPRSLADHCNKDRMLVYQSKTWDNTLNGDSQWYEHAAFLTDLFLDPDYYGHEKQVLVVLDVETASGPQEIQVFVGSQLVREQTISGRENIAFLYDILQRSTFFVRPKTIYKLMYFYRASIFII